MNMSELHEASYETDASLQRIATTMIMVKLHEGPHGPRNEIHLQEPLMHTKGYKNILDIT